MIKNIAIIGIPQQFVKTVSKFLADKIEMFYADVDDMFAYEIKDLKNANTKSAKSYLIKQQSKQTKIVSTFENTIITASFSALINSDNYKFFKKNSLIVYLSFNNEDLNELLKQEPLTTSKETIEKITTTDKDKFFSSICNIKVEAESIEEFLIAKQIVKLITNYYE